jgi:hypothetical protein
MSEPTANDMMSTYALDAVDLAHTRFDVELDFSERSIEALEGILGRLHATIPTGFRRALRRGPTQEQLDQMAKIWGAYLGEVMRRLWGGEWATHTALQPGYILTLKLGEQEVYPPAKAYKRMVNGQEDKVWHYYQVLRRAHSEPSGAAT